MIETMKVPFHVMRQTWSVSENPVDRALVKTVDRALVMAQIFPLSHLLPVADS